MQTILKFLFKQLLIYSKERACFHGLLQTSILTIPNMRLNSKQHKQHCEINKAILFDMGLNSKQHKQHCEINKAVLFDMGLNYSKVRKTTK